MFYSIITMNGAVLLLAQLMAENNGGACALRQSIKKYSKLSF